MKIVVLKFGGTSLANIKLMNNAARRVGAEVEQGNKVVVVVSAMAGVTDHLVSLTHEISQCVSNNALAEYSSVLSTGEQVSAGLFSLILQELGYKSRSWLGWQAGIKTLGNIDDAVVDIVDPTKIFASFASGYDVAVVTGFQGISKEERISTLGRGGSDTTAIIMAGALSATKCEIYTDVEGVFTADPRIVAKAQKLDCINYDEMIALADAGAKVLQTKSAILAKKYNINLQVLSSFTFNLGTMINESAPSRRITGIALSKDDLNNLVAKITIIGKNVQENELLQTIVKDLDNNKIEVIEFIKKDLSVVLYVKDVDKFTAMRCMHSVCGLDQASDN